MRKTLARLTLTAALFVAGVGAAWACPPPLPNNARVADTTPEVEVLWNGVWWDATVADERRDTVKVHYIGWERGWDEWVSPDRLRAPDLARLQRARAGQHVEINWRGGWWPGRVVRAAAGRYEITYDGYGPEWNETVTSERLRAPRTGQI